MCIQFTVSKIQLEPAGNLQNLETGFKFLGMAQRYLISKKSEVYEYVKYKVWVWAKA